MTFSHTGEAEAGVNLDNDKYGTEWYQADLNTDLGTLEIRKRISGIMTTVATMPFSFSANTTYWMRIDVAINNGSAIVQTRAWQNGTTEPTNWQLIYTDTTPLPAGMPGAMGDWFKAPPTGTQTHFLSWAYATNGLAVAAK